MKMFSVLVRNLFINAEVCSKRYTYCFRFGYNHESRDRIFLIGTIFDLTKGYEDLDEFEVTIEIWRITLFNIHVYKDL